MTETFGALIYTCRKQYQHTQKEMANRLNTTERTLLQYELGVETPPHTLIEAIAHTYPTMTPTLLVQRIYDTLAAHRHINAYPIIGRVLYHLQHRRRFTHEQMADVLQINTAHLKWIQQAHAPLKQAHITLLHTHAIINQQEIKYLQALMHEQGKFQYISDVGIVCRLIRTRHNETQREMAERINIPVARLSQTEYGKVPLREDIKEALEATYVCTADETQLLHDAYQQSVKQQQKHENRVARSEIAQYIRQLRKKHQDTQRDMADKISVHPVIISTIENDRKVMKPHMVEDIINAYALPEQDAKQLRTLFDTHYEHLQHENKIKYANYHTHLHVGSLIRDIRIAANEKQSNMAKKLGIAHNAISNIERGIRLPHIEVVTRLFDAYHIKPSIQTTIMNQYYYDVYKRKSRKSHLHKQDKAFYDVFIQLQNRYGHSISKMAETLHVSVEHLRAAIHEYVPMPVAWYALIVNTYTLTDTERVALIRHQLKNHVDVDALTKMAHTWQQTQDVETIYTQLCTHIDTACIGDDTHTIIPTILHDVIQPLIAIQNEHNPSS